MSALKSNPLTVNVCDAEAVPEQVVKLVNVSVTVITGATTIFVELVTMGFKEVL